MLLYCTREEAIDILTAAKKDFHLTGENYVWVVTQSVIENPLQAPYQFPVGMLGESGYDNCTASLWRGGITSSIIIGLQGSRNSSAV